MIAPILSLLLMPVILRDLVGSGRKKLLCPACRSWTNLMVSQDQGSVFFHLSLGLSFERARASQSVPRMEVATSAAMAPITFLRHHPLPIQEQQITLGLERCTTSQTYQKFAIGYTLGQSNLHWSLHEST